MSSHSWGAPIRPKCPERYLEYLHRLARESRDDGGGDFVPWQRSKGGKSFEGQVLGCPRKLGSKVRISGL